jgi:glyceraldehyde-3-phosphate dehydrogenase type I
MVIKIAINGFGRIGRLVFRAIREMYPEQCRVVAVHDIFDIDSNVHLLKFDSTHGIYKEKVTINPDRISFTVGEGPNAWVVRNLDGRVGPSQLPWRELEVDFVLESTGIFKAKCQKDADGKITRDGYDGHIFAGAKKVLLSVPASDKIDCTLVCGVNDEALKPEAVCISNASCTTNCLGPITKVLNNHFKIVSGFMTTVHAYTNDQLIVDAMHSDLRRARAAAINIIPTSTGAAKALPEVIPSLTTSFDGMAIRVPTVTVSLVDLTVNVEAVVTKDQVNKALREASQTAEMKGIIEYSTDHLVSCDIIHNPYSAVVDSQLTKVLPNPTGQGSLVKVLAWYDNEWMYSCRCADIFVRLGSFL